MSSSIRSRNPFKLTFHRPSQSSISIFIGEHFLLLQSLSDTLQAAIPRRISISAFKMILSPAFDSGRSTEIDPSVFILVYMKIFTGWIIGLISSKLLLILSKQFGWAVPFP